MKIKHMKYSISIFLFLLIFQVDGQILSPNDFFEGSYGTKFTFHHEVIDYADHINNTSSRVKMMKYGKSNEGRPLVLLFISSEKNLEELEDIRISNLANAGYNVNNPQKSKPIIWLSFGVHGNEAGATESAINVMYELASSEKRSIVDWLDKTIIILDPCVNPDGFSRYSNWVNEISSTHFHPELTDIEHMEPWPTGRVNHYLFDLNRDWAWQTQVETRQRMKVYNQWLPHIHVDFHEMGYNDHYYFAPAAEPMHHQLSDFQREFQTTIGKNNAKYFDENGWYYFTREIFDLFYPSYGDTYPMFNGAVGMTYEKAGHGMAGRSISMNNGDTLTLKDRIEEHTTTALSTIEAVAKNNELVLENFKNYFQEARNNPKGKFKSYVLKAGKNQKRLVALLQNNGIEVFDGEVSTGIKGYNYFTMSEQMFDLNPGDKVVTTDQPKSVLTQVLLEPQSALSDSLTYDITAWSLPYAFGVDCYGLKKIVPHKDTCTFIDFVPMMDLSAYAFRISIEEPNFSEYVSKLLQEGIQLKYAKRDIRFNNVSIERGDVIVSRADNKSVADLGKVFNDLTKGCVYCDFLSSGWSKDKGGDLGGSGFQLIKAPKTLLIVGDGTSNNEVGQIWHYFDEVIKYPLSRVEKENLESTDLSIFNVVILPDGWYEISDEERSILSKWVEEGGTLIVMGNIVNGFAGVEGFSLVKNPDASEEETKNKTKTKSRLDHRTQSYEDQERRSISRSMPGAIVETNLDTSHSLAFGLSSPYYSLKTSNKAYALQTDVWNVFYVPQDFKYAGFIGSETKEDIRNTLSYGVEEKGGGKVVYMVDNPLFRGFWENGYQIFSNALFFVNQ